MDLMALVPDIPIAPIIQDEPCVEHICETPPKEDPLLKVISGSSSWSKFQRWFLSTRILSREHPFTLYYLKSTQAIDYEINRHLQMYPRMIHPFSTFRIYWETGMVPFFILGLFVTPIFITFYFDEVDKWYYYNFVIDVVFMIDILLWFFTGYYDSRTQLIVLDPKSAARMNLRSNFFLGLFLVFPLEYIIVVYESLWYLAALNVWKLLWIPIIISYSRRLYHVYQIDFHLYKVAEISVLIILCVHWAACMEYYFPLVMSKLNGENNTSWIRSSYMKQRRTRIAIYITCLNRSIIALIGSTHYLNVSTPEDIIYNLILSVLGVFGFIYLLAQFLQLMTTFHSTRKKHLKLIQQLQQFMRHKELPYSLQRRLLTYYNYRNKKGFERDKIIINHVSSFLQEKLLLHNYRRLLDNVELFQYLPQTVVTKLVGVIRFEIFMSNDVLVSANSYGDALYFVACGTVSVYNNLKKEICHLESESYFGELALLMEDERWSASVIAVENSVIYILPRANFQYILKPYPDLLAYLENIALTRLEQTPLLEKARELNLSKTSGNVNISSIKMKRRN